MRRLTAWIGGVAGGIAAYRFFRRHPQAGPETVRAQGGVPHHGVAVRDQYVGQAVPGHVDEAHVRPAEDHQVHGLVELFVQPLGPDRDAYTVGESPPPVGRASEGYYPKLGEWTGA